MAVTAGLVARGMALAGRAPGIAPRLSILIFHRIVPEIDPLFPDEIDAARFRRLMSLVRAGFCVLPLNEAVRRLAGGGLPANALSITFDDGYADNIEVAAPILHQLGLPATVFVSTGFLDGGRMWNDTAIESVRRTALPMIDLGFLGLPPVPVVRAEDRRAAINRMLPILKYRHPSDREQLVFELQRACGNPALPCNLMMSRNQVRALGGWGIAVGAHTVNHPILQSIADIEAEREVAGGKAELESLVGRSVSLFAYPNGRPGDDFGERHVELVRSLGFEAAVTTAPGHNSSMSDPFRLRRFSPWDASDTRWIARLAWSHLRRQTA